MIWRFILLISCFIGFLSITLESSAYTFTPGTSIAMTGASSDVRFDVRESLFASGIVDKYPTLTTSTQTFSGAFYLSGAGWVLFNTWSYQVNFDCGTQSLSLLTTPCTLSGTAWGEMVGDVIFQDRKVSFDPKTALLSGTMSTYVGDYSLSGIILPLIPAGFTEWKTVSANHEATLTISGSSRYYGLGSWKFSFTPNGYTEKSYSSPFTSIDLSHASGYTVDITDQNGSITTITDFKVVPWVPSTNLYTSSTTIHKDFCTTFPIDSLCPDGAALEPMSLTPNGPSHIANGADYYNFRLRIRDQYGNATSGGDIKIVYTDTVDNIQAPIDDYGNYYSEHCFLCSATIWSWSFNNLYGTYELDTQILWDITYGFASIAPTDVTNSLSLSGILYTDLLWFTTEISTLDMKVSLEFEPWYSSSLSVVWDITVGAPVGFSGSLSHVSPLSTPTASSIYHILIGDNFMASFADFSGSSISCKKYFQSSWMNECNWSDLWLTSPVVISTSGSSFTGIYTPHTPDPLLEPVTYKSYITYETGGVRVMYASTGSSLWSAKYGTSALLVLGQNNVWNQYNGVKSSSKYDIWNTIHKTVTLLSRNRTTFNDVDYSISSWNISVNSGSFTNKRSIIVIGADITITGNITQKDHPLSIIALTDANGNGGNIHIDSSVTDIESSLFAEHSVFSSGSAQLYIHGSLISANTTGDTLARICPYYVTSCVDPAKYDLEKIRPTFDPAKSAKSLSTTATTHPWVALIIEYDGRMLRDPPPGLSK